MSLQGEERKNKILHMLEMKGRVETGTLAKALKVSTETIRRDLDELEGAGKLKKVYGGAVKTLDGEEAPHLVREVVNVEAKKRIGHQAAAMVNPGDTIFVDEGTTTLKMISYLQQIRGLTVFTNSFPAASALMDYTNKQSFHGKIIFIGGEVNSGHARTAGSLTEHMMDSFYFTKAFISIDGMDPEAGFTGYDGSKSMLAAKVIRRTKEAFIVADSSKIRTRASYRIAGLHEIHAILCENPPPPEWQTALEAADTRWIVVP
ncbi:DeoR/GlpR family DNA-binding transcription regulator [Paenibacillus sp. J2TS4]|uniref:DeoR/GlpR family DNA-binding transcription regulator n=1 Tax=Paenibacillus sp. J2TS4 TaxID=2807194 RepID=UPI001B145DF3|nr:DeoR/GlpR family DNA-binding transcription regulator [Paenibacillus sp. J2TS4]GIP36533.1 DeoR family transcriptional regulator [Paenibacillus sp. J2TS4]